MEAPLSRRASALTILALAPAAIQLLVALHESGHALAALALGATIQDFEVSVVAGKPHVSYAGLADPARAAATAAGPALTLLAWLSWLLVRRQRSAWERKLLLVGSAGALFPLVMWCVLPVVHANGRRVRDDSVAFVTLTGASPYLVSGIALVLLVGCAGLFSRRVNLGEALRTRLTPIVSPRVHLVLCAAVLLATLLGSHAWR